MTFRAHLLASCMSPWIWVVSRRAMDKDVVRNSVKEAMVEYGEKANARRGWGKNAVVDARLWAAK